MRIYLPDHRVVKVDRDEYKIAQEVFGDRIVIMGVHDADPTIPYLSKKTKIPGRDPMVQLEVIPLPKEKRRGYLWLAWPFLLGVATLFLSCGRAL